jgi:HAD superfamily hydrolase (TIGR01484 family)
MIRPKLLALDIDGTLLKHDGTTDPRDAAAIVKARAAGITVTLATGRLASGSLAIARSLELDVPLVCADGATLVDPRTGAYLEARTLDVEVAEAIMLVLDAHALSRFVFTHDVIHGDELGRAHLPYVTAWTLDVRLHERLAERAPWRADGAITMAIGIGAEDSVARARAIVARDHSATVDLLGFPLRGGDHALRMLRRGVSKADGLARLCARLGIEREDVTVVGDWLNDLSMFAWAGRSFAMGQAPPSVRDAATDRLHATATTGGGVAEAIARAFG